jgi:hypothetical protein
MANASLPSTKRIQIDKASTVIVVSLAVASFITVFSLVASKALLSQRSYQAKVITKKEKARDQLKSNIEATNSLASAYKAFTSTSQNIINGNPTGTGPNDGDSAKIILDALPSQYDFPALATSLEKLLSQNGIKINSITGIDDQLAQEKNQSSSTPQPIDMPFEVNVTSVYGNVQNIVSLMGKSIRPINIQSLSLSGTDNNLTVDVKAKTFYQPEKNLQIKSVEVK